jgi:formylglycine-generating enzyme required for sulfatase activity
VHVGAGGARPNWEYAARGVTDTSVRTIYSWGNDIGKNRANCDGCGSKWDNKQTASVGSFSANVFGLHDVHGNVWEWVQDCYKNTYATAPLDGRATSDDPSCHRVRRGGSWDFSPQGLRAAYRYRSRPDDRKISFGFRVARTLNP